MSASEHAENDNNKGSYGDSASTTTEKSFRHVENMSIKSVPYYINEVFLQDVFLGKTLVVWLTCGTNTMPFVQEFVLAFCNELFHQGMIVDQGIGKFERFSQTRFYSWNGFQENLFSEQSFVMPEMKKEALPSSSSYVQKKIPNDDDASIVFQSRLRKMHRTFPSAAPAEASSPMSDLPTYQACLNDHSQTINTLVHDSKSHNKQAPDDIAAVNDSEKVSQNSQKNASIGGTCTKAQANVNRCNRPPTSEKHECGMTSNSSSPQTTQCSLVVASLSPTKEVFKPSAGAFPFSNLGNCSSSPCPHPSSPSNSSVSLPSPVNSSVPPPPPLPSSGNSSVPPPPPLPSSGNSSVPPPPPLPAPGDSLVPPPPPLPFSNNSLIPSPPPLPPSGNLLVPPPPPLLSSGNSLVPPPPSLPSSSHMTRRQKLLKPLYWTKIKLFDRNKDIVDHELVWKNIKPTQLDESELETLFCKQVVVEKKAPSSKKKKLQKNLPGAKILDFKKSQAIGIFMSSLHVEIDDVKQAVIKADTSVIDMELLEAIYELRPQANELEQIRSFVKKQSRLPADKQQALDKPECFLHSLWEISEFSDRIFCIIFTNHYRSDLDEVLKTLRIIDRTCDGLKTDSVLKLLGIILSVGNFLNQGNRTRGGADGFKLDILPKLKDVKSNIGTNLLSFIAKTFISMSENDEVDLIEISSPLPSALDIIRSSHVKYRDLETDLHKIKKKLIDCKLKATKLIESIDDKDSDSFHKFMEQFLKEAFLEMKQAEKRLQESQLKFNSTAIYFGIQPKDLTADLPKEFFCHWLSFCTDLNAVWSGQLKKLIAEKKRNALAKRDEKRASLNIVKSNLRKQTKPRLPYTN